jgi:hypothetical protein
MPPKMRAQASGGRPCRVHRRWPLSWPGQGWRFRFSAADAVFPSMRHHGPECRQSRRQYPPAAARLLMPPHGSRLCRTHDTLLNWSRRPPVWFVSELAIRDQLGIRQHLAGWPTRPGDLIMSEQRGRDRADRRAKKLPTPLQKYEIWLQLRTCARGAVTRGNDPQAATSWNRQLAVDRPRLCIVSMILNVGHPVTSPLSRCFYWYLRDISGRRCAVRWHTCRYGRGAAYYCWFYGPGI